MDTFRRFIKKRNFVVILLSIVFFGCSDSGIKLNNFSKGTTDNASQDVPGNGGSPGDSSDINVPPNKEPVTKLNFCSRLELASIKWPIELTEIERDSYALALNITGSYEGHNDWQNIANDFDGQGISLGIFQQNLGQGSLQPLLIEVAEEYSLIYRQFFTRNQTESIFAMLTRWEGDNGLGLSGVKTKITRSPASLEKVITKESLTKFYSPLDIPDNENVRPEVKKDKFYAKASTTANQKSVDWAVNNLYESNRRTFRSDWKRGFQALAGDPRYVSKQVKAGHIIHKKAMKFMEIYETKELKSYLFFFDIVVQNGGIRESTRQKYLAEVNQTPDMSENDKMRVLIKHRVLRSREQYRDDVLARKLTILNGEGVVHRRNRDLRSEFCTPDYDKAIK